MVCFIILNHVLYFHLPPCQHAVLCARTSKRRCKHPRSPDLGRVLFPPLKLRSPKCRKLKQSQAEILLLAEKSNAVSSNVPHSRPIVSVFINALMHESFFRSLRAVHRNLGFTFFTQCVLHSYSSHKFPNFDQEPANDIGNRRLLDPELVKTQLKNRPQEILGFTSILTHKIYFPPSSSQKPQNLRSLSRSEPSWLSTVCLRSMNHQYLKSTEGGLFAKYFFRSFFSASPLSFVIFTIWYKFSSVINEQSRFDK